MDLWSPQVSTRRGLPAKSAKKLETRFPTSPEAFNTGGFLSNRESIVGTATWRKSAVRTIHPASGGRRMIHSRTLIGRCVKKIRKSYKQLPHYCSTCRHVRAASRHRHVRP